MVGWIIFLGQPTAFSGKLRMVFVQLGTPFVKAGRLFSLRPVASRSSRSRTRNCAERMMSCGEQVQTLGETGDENLRLAASFSV